MILRKMDIAAREILYLRLIPGERRAMFLPCWQNWDILPPLSEKSAGRSAAVCHAGSAAVCHPGADLMLQEKEIPAEVIQNSRMFHFGALSMTREPARQATKKAIRIAEEAGCICSFDPNLRPSLWNSMEEAKAQVVWGLQHCQILKISDNELEWLTGTDDYDWGADRIRSRFRIPLVLVSMGKNGSLAYWENIKAEAPAFLNNGPAETTGAGDTFMGCVLGHILKNGLDHLTKHDLCRMLTFANAAASIVTTRKGALKAMPEKEEILKLLHQI